MADFIKHEILTGLQKLYALRLSGAPAEDTLQATASVWLEIIIGVQNHWVQELDQGRITKAFNRLLSDVDRWPAPKNLIDRLPHRKAEHQRIEVVISTEQRRINQERIRSLLEQLSNKLTVN